MSKIRMTFKQGQAVQIEADGITGGKCHDITKPFADVIGGKLVKDTEKPEAYLPEQQPQIGDNINIG